MDENKQFLPEEEEFSKFAETIHRVKENTFGGLFDIPVLQ